MPPCLVFAAGPGTEGDGVNQFSLPADVAVDAAGRIYVADSYNNRIVRMNNMTGTGWASLGMAGSHADQWRPPGTNQFYSPSGVAVDAAGRVYVADTNNHRIVRIDDMTGTGWTELK